MSSGDRCSERYSQHSVVARTRYESRTPCSGLGARDEDGLIRLGRTRVTLASVVYAFDAGATPEEIVQKYPTLDLASDPRR